MAAGSKKAVSLGDRAADHETDFLQQHTRVRNGGDLATVLSIVRARRRAGRLTADNTLDYLDDLGIEVTERDGEPMLTRE